MTKRKIFIGTSIVLLLFLALISFFYVKYGRGIWPALLPAKNNIAELIDMANKGPAENKTGLPLMLPDQLSISVFARDLNAPREIIFDPKGRIVASIPSQGKVVLLPDENKDGLSDRTVTLISNLNRPNGLAFHCTGGTDCRIFIAEVNQVTSYAYDSASLALTDKKKLIDLPSGGNHTSRTLLIHSSNDSARLLVATGSSCNVCYEKDNIRTKILSMNLDGGDVQTFASGLRNAVFMTRSPFANQIWATEMGRDLLGDDLPPDELNILEPEKDFGFPLCFGRNIHDTNFDKNTYIQDPCNGKTAPHIEFPAHSAPLGLAFIPESWPEYKGDLLVAFHGSWNRSQPTGYKIVRYDLDGQGNVLGVTDFISGWLKDGAALGRPVDLEFDSSGSLYISDDKAGVMYKVSRQ
jgi:glucose/arabinose dehydrogenase